MTLNQIIKRIRTIALAHKQIRVFKTGLSGDLFAEHTSKYPACCLEYTAGSVNISGGSGLLFINFKLLVLDLVHVSEDTKLNQDDVLSDTLSILMDLVAQLNFGAYNDWKIGDGQITAVEEYENDMNAGWYIDFQIKTPFTQDVCKIPTDLVIDPTPDDMADKLVYDVKYVTTGDEVHTVHIDEIVGKKVLFVTIESNPVYKISANPESDEYVWDNNDLVFGVTLAPLQKILVLYRTY